MKKKILLISESMSGGLRKHVVQLIENLDKEKYEIYFIHGVNTLDDDFLSRYETLKLKAKLIPCDSLEREINVRKDLETYQFIAKKIYEIKPDIVHCHSSKAGAIGRIAAKVRKVKKIYYTPHAYSFLAPEFNEKKRRMFIYIEKILSRFATTKTFCVSNGEKNSAIVNSIDHEEKFKVVYNGLPDIKLPTQEEVKQLLGFNSTDIIVGNNARLSEQKNPLLFMNIANEVIEQNKKIHFVWAGDGPLMDEVMRFVQDKHLEDNFHLLGDRKDSELLVAGYDVFLLTSLYEGLPYAPIEALRANVPIVATNVVGNNEVVENGINGFLVELDEPYDFYKVIEKTSNISKENLHLHYMNKFSINSMISGITAEYDI